MMKTLLTATAMAFSIAAVSGSALAETVILNGVSDAAGNFTFYDSRLDNGSAGFATLTTTGTGSFRFETYIEWNNPFNYSSSNNPYVSESFSFGDSQYKYWKRTLTNPLTLYTDFFVEEAYVYNDGSRKEVSSKWVHWGSLEYAKGHNASEYVRDESGEYYYRSIGGNQGNFESTAPFNVSELENQIWANYPTSGYGIFDFQNSFVNYSDGTYLSFADILGEGGMSPGFTFMDSLFSFSFSQGNVDIEWSAAMQGRQRGVGEKTITGVSLAYNLTAVPEPETWAMLLAGLGIVGAVARRRRTLQEQ